MLKVVVYSATLHPLFVTPSPAPRLNSFHQSSRNLIKLFKRGDTKIIRTSVSYTHLTLPTKLEV